MDACNKVALYASYQTGEDLPGYVRFALKHLAIELTRGATFVMAGSDNTALMSLNSALLLSNELINTEYLAMRMMVEIGDYDPADLPEEITSITLSSDIRQLSDDELRHKAQDLVFDSNYMHFKDRIRENVGLCTQSLIRSSSLELENASSRMTVLVNLQTVLTILFLLIVFAVIYFISTLIRKPLTKMVDLMRTQETIPPTGAEELRFVTRTYNYILEENRIARERLSHEASHDSLTEEQYDDHDNDRKNDFTETGTQQRDLKSADDQLGIQETKQPLRKNDKQE